MVQDKSGQDKTVQSESKQDESRQDKATQGDATKTEESQAKATPHPALTDPKLANKKAPDTFRVRVETTKGDFIVEVTRDWSPNGADRFYNLVDIGYFDNIAIFRAIKGFMFQFGIHGVPAVSEHWSEANIPDDPNKSISNKPGTITFAKSGAPDSRSTQLFINLGNNQALDGQGFTPFGKVVEGMDVVSQINTEYGENSPDVQGRFQSQGNAFITKRYPKIDFIKAIKLIEEE
jgi:peptidyl-prolyl cis-trans isomerase A (cyclophilin A)